MVRVTSSLQLYNDDYSIVAQYQAEYRGFVQYYLKGFNAHRLWNVHRVMQKSLLGTLANKHRTTVSRIVRCLRTEVTVGDKTIKALQIVRHRGQGKNTAGCYIWRFVSGMAERYSVLR